MGKYIYTYIENEQMYEESPSLAELLAREGFFCKKIVTGRIEYIKVKDFETQIKDAQWLVFTSKNAVAGFAYNAGNVVPAGVKVAVVGKNTQNALRTACGIEADCFVKSYRISAGRRTDECCVRQSCVSVC